MFELTILYDNTSRAECCSADHGFACVIDAHGQRILFDTGAAGELLLRNMECLGVDPGSIDSVFISHPHWDHIGGLAAFLARASVPVLLPASAAPVEVEQPIYIDGPTTIGEGLHSTGQLPALDYPLQEHSLLVETPQGIIVVVGCAHPGVDRILSAAADRGRLRALVGGLHGFRRPELLEGLELVCPTHCTKFGDEIRAACPESAVDGGAGRTIRLGAS